MDKGRPFKLVLTPEVAKVLDHIAADLKSDEGNYQIGVGTVAARLLETLSAHPELISKLLTEYAQKTVDTENDARPFAQSRGQKKAAK